MIFDTFVVVDWSAGNDTGPRPRRDAIWIGIARDGVEVESKYLRNRQLAEAQIADLIEDELTQCRRVLLGFDFPFGYPRGFASLLTGRHDPLAVWKWFSDHLMDTPQQNSRFDLAGEINLRFGGSGPFWFNGLKRDIAGLPRRKTDRWMAHSLPELRTVERQTKGVFSCWQMGGAGAVGGQAMTGQATLWRLRGRFSDKVAVWPFERLDRAVVFAEVWPSLVNDAVRVLHDPIRDRAQVRTLAHALSCLEGYRLHSMLEIDAPEEGWILGAGLHHAILAEVALSAGLAA